MSFYSKTMISMELLMPSKIFKIKIQMLQKKFWKKTGLGGKSKWHLFTWKLSSVFQTPIRQKKNYSLALQNKVTSIMSYYHNLVLEKYQQKDKDAWNYQFKFYGKEHWNLFATFGLNARKKQTQLLIFFVCVTV